MPLLNRKLLKRFADIGSKQTPNPLVLARFHHSLTGWEWYPTNYYPEEKLFYGWMSGSELDMCFFSLEELDGMIVWGVPVCRDDSWEEIHLDEVKSYIEA